jgi:hypothetical protein
VTAYKASMTDPLKPGELSEGYGAFVVADGKVVCTTSCETGAQAWKMAQDIAGFLTGEEDAMTGVHHPSSIRYKQLARVCEAADRPCEHPEQARGNDPFCFKCLSCRSGVLLVELARLASEDRERS